MALGHAWGVRHALAGLLSGSGSPFLRCLRLLWPRSREVGERLSAPKPLPPKRNSLGFRVSLNHAMPQ